MAGDWIKFRKSLLKDGRTRIVSRSCHAPVTHVVGALVTLWSLADDFADDEGVIFGYTSDDINSEVGIDNFCESLPGDWIDLSGEWIKLPKYQEHNGATAKKRAQNQERQRRHRAVTKASRIERDKSVTREEKRREEKKESEKEKFTLPDFIAKEQWQAIKKHRKAIRKPLTERASELLIARLTEVHEAGLSVSDAIDLMIERGWTSLRLDWVQNALKPTSKADDAPQYEDLTGCEWVDGKLVRRG